MITVGLTGPTGAGKGLFCLAASQFKNIHSIDTDLTARRVVEKGSPCLNELVQYFGDIILNADGTLNRGLLASLAFSDDIKHAALNSITHRYILLDIENEIRQAENDGNVMCIVDAPLLFESGANKLCHVTVGVLCDLDTRLRRIMERDGITRENAMIRINSQPSDDFYTSKCDHILYNTNTANAFFKQAKNLIQQLLSPLF